MFIPESRVYYKHATLAVLFCRVSETVQGFGFKNCSTILDVRLRIDVNFLTGLPNLLSSRVDLSCSF